MRLPLIVLLSLGLASCSQELHRTTPAAPTHEYVVTFAAVKIPDDIPRQHGCSIDDEGYNFGSLEARYTFAEYVVSHSNSFSFTVLDSNPRLTVRNHQQATARLVLDSSKEEADFQVVGFKTTQFEPGIDVQGEGSKGQVACTWSCSYTVQLKKPIGNSTDHGGSGPFGCCRLDVGRPDITPLFRGDGATLWLVVALNRA